LTASETTGSADICAIIQSVAIVVYQNGLKVFNPAFSENSTAKVVEGKLFIFDAW
jgi:hypothetical protein